MHKAMLNAQKSAEVIVSRKVKDRISRSLEYDRGRRNDRSMAENIENNGYSQRDNAEHEGYVKASRSFNRIWKERDSAQPNTLGSDTVQRQL